MAQATGSWRMAALLVMVVALGVALPGVAAGHPEGPAHHRPMPAHATETMRAFAADTQAPASLAALRDAPCTDGFAGPFPCSNVDLLAYLPLADIGGSRSNSAANDIWGWTDPATGREYAIIGRVFATAFVDITDPVNPVYLGELPTHGAFGSSWRDIKVHANHAFIVSEALNHGMQVFDLRQLRDVASPPVTFSETAHYNQVASAHNIAINEDSGFAYVVGASGKNSCAGGLHMVDIRTPTSPSFAGCFDADGYTHDTQCVVYTGPDTEHHNREICLNSNEDTVTIVDVTNKANPRTLSRTGYSGSAYTHQGWLTGDQRYFLVDDELDERDFGHPTRTRVFDVADLDAPTLVGFHDAAVPAIDHNQYVKDGLAYQANYRAGLRILDLGDVANANLSELGFFDVYPDDDAPEFNGAWSTYPFFASGVVIISGIEQGLFVVRPNVGGGGGGTDDPPTVTVTSPADGATVSGEVTVAAEARDDDAVAQVEFFVDGVSIGLGQQGTAADSWFVSWDSTAVADGSHTVSAVATDSAGQTARHSVSVTVDNVADPALHVGDLDAATRLLNGGHWQATVTVSVHDAGEGPVGGVAVSGTWSDGSSASCTTGGDGRCAVTSGRLHRNSSSVTFAVGDLAASGFTYDSGVNHDPDGDSDGTSIVVAKP